MLMEQNQLSIKNATRWVYRNEAEIYQSDIIQPKIIIQKGKFA